MASSQVTVRRNYARARSIPRPDIRERASCAWTHLPLSHKERAGSENGLARSLKRLRFRGFQDGGSFHNGGVFLCCNRLIKPEPPRRLYFQVPTTRNTATRRQSIFPFRFLSPLTLLPESTLDSYTYSASFPHRTKFRNITHPDWDRARFSPMRRKVCRLQLSRGTLDSLRGSIVGADLAYVKSFFDRLRDFSPRPALRAHD